MTTGTAVDRRRVILAGHCGADSASLTRLVRDALGAVEVVGAHDDAALRRAGAAPGTLALVNRVLDGRFDDAGGVDLIRRLRPSLPAVVWMLVSDYADAQAAAVAAGALPGFGKSDLRGEQARARLRAAFAPPAP